MSALKTRRSQASIINVRAKNATFSFECKPGERVLYAGLRSGIALPYECATGTCGTCKARGKDVPIDETWPAAPGRSYLKPERGEFLMCQSVSRGTCEIEVPAIVPDMSEEAILPHYNRGKVGGVRGLTHDVMFFEIDLEQPMSFGAGQFLVVDVPDIEGFRAYSMVNYGVATCRLQFVAKKKWGGAFSDWLFGPMVDGKEVAVFGPLGKAVFDPKEDKNVLAIAGGSGIAGIMSILSRATQERYFQTHEGFVFFGVRTIEDCFFLDELSAFVEAAPDSLRVTVAVSEEEPPVGRHPDHPALELAYGFVHSVAGQAMAGRFDNVAAFVAGPPPMVDTALRMLIIDARLPAADIRYDKFG